MITRAALMLVDVQQDFLSHPRLEPDAEFLTARIAELLTWFRARGWPVVHVRTKVSPDLSDAMPHWQAAANAVCVDGTPGAQPPKKLVPDPEEPVFTKRFYDGFEDPDVIGYLRQEGVDTLVLTGVHTHACVRTTALAAYSHGLKVLMPLECVGSYDPVHAAATRDWINGRAAECLPLRSLQVLLAADAGGGRALPAQTWLQHNPSDWTEILAEIPLMSSRAVREAANRLDQRQGEWGQRSLAERLEKLRNWQAILQARRELWVTALVRDVGKPYRDAEGEVAYALALLDNVCRTAADVERQGEHQTRYRPLGTVGLITPWNNPFAMPISKIAPALAYGNCALWKPALPGVAIASMLAESLDAVGLGNWVEVVTGDASTGRALVESPNVAAISFTGSVEVGQDIARRCGRLLRPVQAELGGNNAAIVLKDAEVETTAANLAAAMFSFAGQRCTAIRRVIVEEAIWTPFVEALRAAVLALRTGAVGDRSTHVGPVISKAHQQMLLGLVRQAQESGATILTGGCAPEDCPAEGCWIAPTLITDLPEVSPILRNELFGPVVALVRARSLGDALIEHNRGVYGLLGALYTSDKEAQARFLAEAQAGLLLLNEARPAFSAAGPFVGWKASSYGIPEHGRWNRDFYTQVQAVYDTRA